MPLLMLKDLPRYECLLKAAEHYPSLDVSACELFLNLLRTADELFEAKSNFLARYGLSQGRFTVLMLLERAGEPCTPAALADESRVTRATMTGLVDTLEKDGFVVREPDPEDRRTIHVRLTNQGHSLMEKMLPDYFGFVSSTGKPLSKAERKQLVGLLQKIQGGLASEREVSPNPKRS